MNRCYPGNEYIDRIGVSWCAAHILKPLVRLKEILDPAVKQTRRFSPDVVNGTKPITIAELGAINHPPQPVPLSKANGSLTPISCWRPVPTHTDCIENKSKP